VGGEGKVSAHDTAGTKVLGVMKGVGFGVRDRDRAMLWFNVYTSECSASLQCIPAARAIELIEKHGIENVKDLEGKPCWVQDEGAIIRFIDFADI
jgi:hypothetical protein